MSCATTKGASAILVKTTHRKKEMTMMHRKKEMTTNSCATAKGASVQTPCMGGMGAVHVPSALRTALHLMNMS
jgi:hypothetical protein